ncbi:hypothetical protein Dip518_000169 [Parelusimicrobium proximum]|uniref:hypothetical protein n=1 Tax=Parelusimicrobium proximum TaxID=3228953 RepID=UPI003D17A264
MKKIVIIVLGLIFLGGANAFAQKEIEIEKTFYQLEYVLAKTLLKTKIGSSIDEKELDFTFNANVARGVVENQINAFAKVIEENSSNPSESLLVVQNHKKFFEFYYEEIMKLKETEVDAAKTAFIFLAHHANAVKKGRVEIALDPHFFCLPASERALQIYKGTLTNQKVADIVKEANPELFKAVEAVDYLEGSGH